jgi:large subunit ribosomal protein L35
MPKVKTRKAVSKRFKVTKSGKVTRNNSKARHLLTCKNRKKKRKLRHSTIASDSDTRNIKAMMPYG